MNDHQQELLRAGRKYHFFNLFQFLFRRLSHSLCLSFSQFRNKKLITRLFKGVLSSLRQFLATESPLKMMKNAFYFTLKVLFVLKISKFLSWLFGHVSKRLIKKVRLISIFMTSQTIVKHILHNISRSKGNQAMKFGEIMEHNIRNIFLKTNILHKMRWRYYSQAFF